MKNHSPKAGRVSASMWTKGVASVSRTPLAATSTPDFQTVIAFCAIGLLVMLNVMLRFPDIGIVIEQFNKF